MKRAIVLCTLSILVLTSGIFAGDRELFPVYPKIVKDRLVEPANPWTDQLYAVTRADNTTEYYLSSGAANDTFFMVLEPLAACSVHSFEIQWFDAGNVMAFAAYFSDEAMGVFPGLPDGAAPERGTTDISPIGDWITPAMPITAGGTQDWEDLDLGDPFVIGNPPALPSEIFGVGYIKADPLPHPLADNVAARGIPHSYTWFGGPWMAPPTYEYPWGAYTSSYTGGGPIVEVTVRAWVSYDWGMPILISDITSLSDTYNLTGPFPVSCMLVDDNGITGDDTIELVYTVNAGVETHVDLVDIEPTGDDIYGADIVITGAVGDLIDYWIYTLDDDTLENTEPFPRKSFTICEPRYPNSDILFVDEGNDEIELNPWNEVFEGGNVEFWSIGDHGGIDASVVNAGWGTVFIVGWGCSSIPALDEENPYSDFLDNGGNLFLTDQDYFYANNLDSMGTFSAGDFAYDYFGLIDFRNDPSVEVDTSFYGLEGDPISDDFADVSYWTTYEDPGNIWCDFFTATNEIFFGDDFDHCYGATLDDGNFKTVFLGFNAWFGCDPVWQGDTLLVNWVASEQFTTLVNNVIAWFGAEGVEPFNEGTPYTFSLNQNYPNPFNPSTSIAFTLGVAENVSLKVFNLMGQEVATLVNKKLNPGPHMVSFDASDLPSGIYYYRLNAGDFNETKKMLLVK